jgi:hypothetical protein
MAGKDLWQARQAIGGGQVSIGLAVGSAGPGGPAAAAHAAGWCSKTPLGLQVPAERCHSRVQSRCGGQADGAVLLACRPVGGPPPWPQ